MEWKGVLQLLFIPFLLLTNFYLYVCILNFSSEYFFNRHRQASPDVRKSYANLRYGKYVTLCSGSYNSRRTGNQLFNLAILMYVAKSTGRQMYMPKNIPYGWIDAYFDINITRVDKYQTTFCPCVIAEEDPRGGMIFDLGTNKSFANATTIFICGYFQSWKYTRGIEKELHRILRFRPEIFSAVTKFFRDKVYSTAANVSLTTVGIHVRRGDFLIDLHVKAGFSVADPAYLNNAINYYIELNRKSKEQKKIVFVVCSDGLAWVKSAINVSAIAEYNISFVYSENNSPGFDLCLLSRCDSHIVSTGTFGWWAAWLGNHTTVYYKNYPRPGSRLAQGNKQEDYYPPNWIPML